MAMVGFILVWMFIGDWGDDVRVSNGCSSKCSNLAEVFSQRALEEIKMV